RLVPVDFSGLADPSITGSTTQDVALEAPVAASRFRDASAGLDGYELLAEAEIGKALAAWYAANPDFIWVSDLKPNKRAEEALEVLAEAADYGLSPADYAVEIPAVGPNAGEAAAGEAAMPGSQMIRFEMALSARVLRYVRDAHNGRVNPNRISSGYYDFPAKPLDLSATLDALAGTTDVRAYLEGRHPQNREYQVLRQELEALRASSENEIVVEPGLLLKPGQSSPELPKLLTLIARDLDDEMRGAYGDVLSGLVDSEAYVPELVPVIKAAQKKAGLQSDGVIG